MENKILKAIVESDLSVKLSPSDEVKVRRAIREILKERTSLYSIDGIISIEQIKSTSYISELEAYKIREMAQKMSKLLLNEHLMWERTQLNNGDIKLTASMSGIFNETL